MSLHSLQKLRAGQFMPGGYYDGSFRIVFSQQRHGGIQLRLGNGIRAGQNDGGSGFDLIVVELAKVLHIDLHLAGVCHGNGVTQCYILTSDLFNGGNHITELAYTGGLDDDPLGSILSNHLLQRLTEIAHKATANATGVHFRNINACILQEAAVNADLTEFIFDQH